MAIPPANPPPRYEPPPRRDAPEPSLESPRMGAGRPPDPVVRGCLVAVGVAAALACIGSVALAAGCRGCMQIGTTEGVRHVAAGYRAAATGTSEQEAIDAELSELEHLASNGEITFLAFGILNNRYNDAIADDGRVDVDELHHGMELVHDIVEGHGTIVLDRYPEGR